MVSVPASRPPDQGLNLVPGLSTFHSTVQIVFKKTYYSVGFKKTQNNFSIKIPVRQVPLQAEQELAAHPGAGQARHRHTQLSQRGSEASLPWHGPR